MDSSGPRLPKWYFVAYFFHHFLHLLAVRFLQKNCIKSNEFSGFPSQPPSHLLELGASRTASPKCKDYAMSASGRGTSPNFFGGQTKMKKNGQKMGWVCVSPKLWKNAEVPQWICWHLNIRVGAISDVGCHAHCDSFFPPRFFVSGGSQMRFGGFFEVQRLKFERLFKDFWWFLEIFKDAFIF